MTSCLLLLMLNSFKNGVSILTKEFTPTGANSFFMKTPTVQHRREINENGRVASLNGVSPDTHKG